MHRNEIGEVVSINNVELYSGILSSCLGKNNHRIGIDKKIHHCTSLKLYKNTCITAVQL